MQDNDMATLGRCANNLGIIANMQGDYGRAVGAYTRAIGAYQKARFTRGIAESQHNLGITYREQGRLDDAMQATDAAVREAERVGDQRLKAQALAGRAEIQVLRGEPELAIREAKRAAGVHRDLKDPVREAEDLRILAVALGRSGQRREAEAMFGEVIARASKHERPLLIATAQRDLAYLLAREGEAAAATEAAQTARETLDRLGAKVEVEHLDALLKELGGDAASGVGYAPPPTPPSPGLHPPA
jgi:tetratricopeptide (TPR) repeat protein